MRRLVLFPSLLAACVAVPVATPTPTPTPAAVSLYGPENRWRYATVDEIPSGSGSIDSGSGALFADLAFVDQFGDDVRLWQFAGRLVLLDFAGYWCQPCHEQAPEVEAFWRRQPVDGVMVITVLVGGSDPGVPATEGEVQAWVEEVGATHPVLRLADDADWEPVNDMVEAWPYPVLLDHTMRAHGRHHPIPFDALDRAARGWPGSAEDCADGVDNDIDLVTDCLDEECAGPGCVGDDHTGALEPCAGSATLDVWRIDADTPVSFRVDTVDAEHAFEPIVHRLAGPDDALRDSPVIADDEWACTYRVEQYGCGEGYLPAGASWVAIGAGGGGHDRDGDCVDPELGRYALRLFGGGSATLVSDDQPDGEPLVPTPPSPAADPPPADTLYLFDGEEAAGTSSGLVDPVCGPSASGWEARADIAGSDNQLLLRFAAAPTPGRYWQAYDEEPQIGEVLAGVWWPEWEMFLTELVSGSIDHTDDGRFRATDLVFSDGWTITEGSFDFACP